MELTGVSIGMFMFIVMIKCIDESGRERGKQIVTRQRKRKRGKCEEDK